jgi:hypothetical protein
MDEVFRFDSGNCPSAATAPTILTPSLLDAKNPSNMRIPLECHHLTLYDTMDCIFNHMSLEDLLILIGHSDEKAKAMMHGDEGIGVDGLKELDPVCYTHDGIHVDDIM